jgi:hypothetical protein
MSDTIAFNEGGYLTWHPSRPPIEQLEYEMDVRGVTVERVLSV